MAKERFGLIGHPVRHSMSAVMHKAAFKKLKLACTYELFDVDEKSLGAFMKKSGGFRGLNVTIPHKVGVIRYLDELSKEAELIEAVNTISIDDKKVGYNTDGVGCVKALKGGGIKAAGSRMLVLGAGGAARAVAYTLALAGADVSVANRTQSKAVELSSDIKAKTGFVVKVVSLKDSDLKEALLENDVLINATSVGMHPNEGGTPVPKSLLNPNLKVMDLVYNPLKTRLLAEAQDVGCETMDGVGMLVNQGAESLRIWLGVKPPVEEMRKAVLKELGHNTA